jgi:hypothetical protein
MLSNKLQLSLRDRKVLAVLFSLILLSTVATAFISYQAGVNAQSSTSVSMQTNSGGPYPGAPNYTFFIENGVYYAKDAHGSITSGAVASTVIQNALNTLTSGGDVKFNTGIFVLSAPLYITYPAITLEGMGGIDCSSDGTILQCPSGNAIVINSDGVNYVPDVKIKNLMIDGINAISNAGTGIRSWGRYTTIENVEVARFSIGISFEWTSSWSCGDNWLNRVVVRNCQYEGITVKSNDNQFLDVYSHENQNGIKLDGNSCGGLLATNIHLWGNTQNGLIIPRSCNDHFVNLYTETNGNYGVLIGSLTGDVKREKFTSTYSWGNTLAALSMDGTGYTISSVEFLGGRFENGSAGTVLFAGTANLAALNFNDLEGFITHKSGSYDIPSGYYVDVPHGLAGAPTSVIVTMASTTAGTDFVSDINNSTFRVNVQNSGTHHFYFIAEYRPYS